MNNYQERITVESISFQRHEQNESHLWDYCYQSETIQKVEGLPAIIKLYVGTRQNDDDLAWTARLYVGQWCLYVDALEHYQPEDTIKRCLSKLESNDVIQHVKELIAAQKV